MDLGLALQYVQGAIETAKKKANPPLMMESTSLMVMMVSTAPIALTPTKRKIGSIKSPKALM
ncbi:hypothetical protein DN464_11555 [Enterobacter cloacae]|nr:hypothetical protein DN464_11555 [Enterobacter cloacae]